MNHSLNIDETLDPIKLFFFSDFQTKEFKEYVRRKVRRLSPYQFYHLLAWLLENLKDDVLVANLDILFDFSILQPEKYHPSDDQSYPSHSDPNDVPVLPDRFGEDCIKFYHMDFGTMKFLSDEAESMESVNRFLFYYKVNQVVVKPEVDYERLLDLMSLDERICFPIYNFPDSEAISFYGHALNFLKGNVEREADSLKYSLTTQLEKEGNEIKKLFVGKSKQELPFAYMQRSALLLPLLVGFEQWKRLAVDALKNKELFNLLKTRLLFLLEELQQVIEERYFQDLTTNVNGKTYIVKNKETGIGTLRSIASPLVNSYEYAKWLKGLKSADLKSAIKKEITQEPKNEIVISKIGSQSKLKKAIIEFLNHIKLKVDDERSRAVESFVYRNFSFEYDENIDFSKRTVNNYGYKPLSFIPSKQAKNFTKLLLYLSDKNYLLSNKTQIIRTLDEDIHKKNGKDGFSYSSLIRIPNDEHHLFPDKTIRRRIRSILKIDD